jgi:hypothetical protein
MPELIVQYQQNRCRDHTICRVRTLFKCVYPSSLHTVELTARNKRQYLKKTSGLMFLQLISCSPTITLLYLRLEQRHHRMQQLNQQEKYKQPHRKVLQFGIDRNGRNTRTWGGSSRNTRSGQPRNLPSTRSAERVTNIRILSFILIQKSLNVHTANMY